MVQNYQLGKIRTFLLEGFSDEELRVLCFDWPEFKPVYYALAHNSGKAEIISRLLEYVERTHQLDHLLDLAKTYNPAKYAEYEPYTPDDSAAGSPYRGLQYFDVSDADLFFGREQLTAKLVARLSGRGAGGVGGRGEFSAARFLAVVGASGSGKSSLVRAGLVPALQRGQPLADGSLPPQGSTRWPIHLITPTAHPLESLAASLTRDSESVTATTTLMDDMSRDPRSLHLYVRKLLTPSPTPLARLSGGGRLLLVVDQFEELFTLCRREDERRAFVDNLLTAAGAPSASEGEGWGGGDGPTLVVLTLRADFYAPCAQYENLREALARYQEYIGPMSGEELRRAIELPAQRAGYEFEPGLVELLLRDVGNEPGALPLLSHALLETWWRREGRRLTLAGYAEAGGVRGAIAQTAESVFGRLTAEQQTIARRIFLRLTELGDGTQDTRRRVARAELEALGTADHEPPTADELSRTPLVVPPGGSALSGQPSAVAPVLQTLTAARLVTTDEETVEVAHEAMIREWPALRQWLNDNREGLRLHRRLSEAAQEWQRMQRDPGGLYRGAKLVQASEWAEQYPMELNTLEQQFLTASKQAEENERLRELEQARALAEAERQRAEVEQQRAEEQKRATARLRKWAQIATTLGVIALIAAVAAGFLGWQANENAKLAATREAEAKQQADVATGHRLAAEGRLLFEEKPLLGLRLAMEGWALSSRYKRYVQIDEFIVEMAQQGQLVALGQGEVRAIYVSEKNSSTFVLDSVNALGELRRIADAQVIDFLSGPVSGVTFSPDDAGTYFFVRYSDDTPGELRRSDDGQLIITLSGPVSGVTFSPDDAGTYFGVGYRGDTPGELRRSADGEIIATLSGPVYVVNFSPDEAGTYFFVDYDDGAPPEVRRSATGQIITTLSRPISAVTFSPDKTGTYFVVSYGGGTPGEVRYPGELRHSNDGRIITTLSGPISGITFSPDEAGTYFVVSYGDGIPGKVGHPGELRRSADGEIIATLSGPVSGVTFSPDEAGSYFIVSYDGDIPGELRRSLDGQVITMLSGPVSRVTFSPDEAGSYFFVRYYNGTPGELRHSTDGQLVHLSGPVSELTFSLDKARTYFVAAYANDQRELWQAHVEPRRLAKLGLGLGNQFQEGFHLDATSERFITWYSDGRAYLLDLA